MLVVFCLKLILKNVKERKMMNQNGAESNNSQANQTAGEANNGEKQVTFTQDQVNELIQKRVNELNKKSDEKTKQAVADALSEYERKAKLTEEERATEAQKEKLKEIEAREHSITMRERKSDCLLALSKKNIPADFADYLIDNDAEKMAANIEGFSTLWEEKLMEGVQAKIKASGATPTDKSSTVPHSGSNPGVAVI
nr:MAG TPA: Major capsid protein [Caudoviricetes sp.]DAX99342.1 MAG TPA: Major capsid protein [Caudoviricetes sp.]